ncbi:hypothetical protein HY624_00575 [Candidatus Uhrbacteria bacterium]|nr:hypothetical protein [Candidatus Uhrbacteria bacterium]
MSSVPCAVTRVRYPNMCTETSTQPPPTEQDLVAIKREQQQQRAEEARLRAEKDRFKLLNPLDFDFTEDLKHGLPYGLGRIASWLLAFTGILAFLMFVWGGRLWLMSGGDPEKVKGGVDTMKWAAIGVILAFGSFMLLTFALELIRKQVG